MDAAPIESCDAAVAPPCLTPPIPEVAPASGPTPICYPDGTVLYAVSSTTQPINGPCPPIPGAAAPTWVGYWTPANVWVPGDPPSGWVGCGAKSDVELAGRSCITDTVTGEFVGSLFVEATFDNSVTPPVFGGYVLMALLADGTVQRPYVQAATHKQEPCPSSSPVAIPMHQCVPGSNGGPKVCQDFVRWYSPAIGQILYDRTVDGLPYTPTADPVAAGPCTPAVEHSHIQAFRDAVGCRPVRVVSVTNPCTGLVTQTIFELNGDPVTTSTPVPRNFRIDSAWNPETDPATGDPTGNNLPAFTEVRFTGQPIQTIPITSSNATGFTSAGTAFGINWVVVTPYVGSQTITADGVTVAAGPASANDNVSLSYSYVTVTGAATSGEIVDKCDETTVVERACYLLVPSDTNPVGAVVPVEILKSVIDGVVTRRVFDDRTEPPTEIIGFNPSRIVDCDGTKVGPFAMHACVAGTCTPFLRFFIKTPTGYRTEDVTPEGEAIATALAGATIGECPTPVLETFHVEQTVTTTSVVPLALWEFSSNNGATWTVDGNGTGDQAAQVPGAAGLQRLRTNFLSTCNGVATIDFRGDIFSYSGGANGQLTVNGATIASPTLAAMVTQYENPGGPGTIIASFPVTAGVSYEIVWLHPSVIEATGAVWTSTNTVSVVCTKTCVELQKKVDCAGGVTWFDNGTLFVPTGVSQPGPCSSSTLIGPVCVALQPLPIVTELVFSAAYAFDNDLGAEVNQYFQVYNPVAGTSQNPPVQILTTPAGSVGNWRSNNRTFEGVTYNYSTNVQVSPHIVTVTPTSPAGPAITFPLVDDGNGGGNGSFTQTTSTPGTIPSGYVQVTAFSNVDGTVRYVNVDGTIYTPPAGSVFEFGECPVDCTGPATVKECNSDAILTELRKPDAEPFQFVCVETQSDLFDQYGFEIGWNQIGATPTTGGIHPTSYDIFRIVDNNPTSVTHPTATAEFAPTSSGSNVAPTSGWVPWVQGTSLAPTGTWFRATIPNSVGQTIIVVGRAKISTWVNTGQAQDITATYADGTPLRYFIGTDYRNTWYNGNINNTGTNTHILTWNTSQFGPSTFESGQEVKYSDGTRKVRSVATQALIDVTPPNVIVTPGQCKTVEPTVLKSFFVSEPGCMTSPPTLDMTNVARCETSIVEVNGTQYTVGLLPGWTVAQFVAAVNAQAPGLLKQEGSEIVSANPGTPIATMRIACSTIEFQETFGTGGSNGARQQVVAPSTTTYSFSPTGNIPDDQYAITSFGDTGLSPWNKASGLITSDSTGNPNGNALIVNAAAAPGEFYRRAVTGLVSGVEYAVRFSIINTSTVTTLAPNVKVNIVVGGSIVATSNTGPITYLGPPWKQKVVGKFTATTPNAEFALVNNQAGGTGNDLAIDSIQFLKIVWQTLTFRPTGLVRPVELIKTIDGVNGKLLKVRVYSPDGLTEYPIPDPNGLILSTGSCPDPGEAAKDYEYVPAEYCVGGSPATRTTTYVNGLVQPAVWTRNDGTVFVPTPVELAAATPGACPIVAMLPVDYEFTDGQYCVAGLPAERITPELNGVLQPPIWTRLNGTVFVPTPAQLALANVGVCPRTINPGSVSIANGIYAVPLGPDGTTWAQPVGQVLKSFSIGVRRGSTTNAVGTGPGAVNDRVQVQTLAGSVYLLQGETLQYSAEDLDALGPVYVYSWGNTAALISYTSAAA
jgi:hypothetical protein